MPASGSPSPPWPAPSAVRAGPTLEHEQERARHAALQGNTSAGRHRSRDDLNIIFLHRIVVHHAGGAHTGSRELSPDPHTRVSWLCASCNTTIGNTHRRRLRRSSRRLPRRNNACRAARSLHTPAGPARSPGLCLRPPPLLDDSQRPAVKTLLFSAAAGEVVYYSCAAGQLSRFSTRRVGGGLGAWTGARRKMGTSAADAEKKLEDKVQAGAPRIVTVRAACLCTYPRLDTLKSALPRERP